MEKIIESVLHPTDFSEGSRIAFYHALKAALLSGAQFTLLNVSPDDEQRWSDFPRVRDTLEHWGLLPPGSPKLAVQELGIEVRKTITQNSDPVDAVVSYLVRHPADLIVLATHQRKGAMRWLSGSVSEPIARHSGRMTLFIPGESRGFVSADDGTVSLQNILIPVALSPAAQPSLEAAARLVKNFNCYQGNFTLVHVGSADTVPSLDPPEVPGWEWRTDIRRGDVIQSIIDAAKETSADLIVMTTDGHNGFLDGLRGSHSERVLRLAGVPLMTLPAGALASDMIG